MTRTMIFNKIKMKEINAIIPSINHQILDFIQFIRARKTGFCRLDKIEEDKT